MQRPRVGAPVAAIGTALRQLPATPVDRHPATHADRHLVTVPVTMGALEVRVRN
jgi:hypothetical protein